MPHLSHRFLVFYLDHHLCAVASSFVQEINHWHQLDFPFAGSTQNENSARLRGTALRLFDLKQTLGLTAVERNGESRIIVMKNNEVLIGIPVDAIGSVIDIANTETTGIRDLALATSVIPRGGPHQGEALIVFNIHHCLNTSRQQAIRDFLAATSNSSRQAS